MYLEPSLSLIPSAPLRHPLASPDAVGVCLDQPLTLHASPYSSIEEEDSSEVSHLRWKEENSLEKSRQELLSKYKENISCYESRGSSEKDKAKLSSKVLENATEVITVVKVT